MSEANVMNGIHAELCKKYPQGLWYRRNVGAVKTASGFVRFGLPGQADLAGIYKSRSIEIEVKSAKGQQSSAQENWQRAVIKAGGIYILARSFDDVKKVIDLL